VFAERKVVQEKNRARQMVFVGRKVPEGSKLEAGIYKGKVTVTRKGAAEPEIFAEERLINVTEDQ
jgi:hypothetical protein